MSDKRAAEKEGGQIARRPRRTRKSKVLADGTKVPRDATLDKLMSIWVRRDGKCELAGHAIPCEGTLEHHHVVPRGRCKALRWHPLNGLCLCQAHHVWYHSHPILAGRLLDEVFGAERWDEVERIQRSESPPTPTRKAEILSWLNKEIKGLS